MNDVTLLDKYPFMANPYFKWGLIGVVIVALVIGFWILKKRR